MVDYSIIPLTSLGIESFQETKKIQEKIKSMDDFYEKRLDLNKKINIRITIKNPKDILEYCKQFIEIKDQLETQYQEYADHFDELTITINYLLFEIQQDPQDKKIYDILEATIRPYRKQMNKMINYARTKQTTEGEYY